MKLEGISEYPSSRQEINAKVQKFEDKEGDLITSTGNLAYRNVFLWCKVQLSQATMSKGANVSR